MASKEIHENPFRNPSKAHIFFDACNLNPSNGYSDIIGIEQLTELGLKTDNGGSWCRSDGPLGKYFQILRQKKGGRIDSVQLVGYAQNDFTGKIDKEIVDTYKNEPCVVLDVSSKYVEVDHKDGRKDDYKLHANQTIDDFQPMHKAVNVAKRSHCKHCSHTGIRFDAKHLGYSESQYIGPSEYHGSCIGCYWHDPVMFNLQVSGCFEKDR